MSAAHRTSLFLNDLIVGLTLSAVALSLGGAFGLLSERGVLAGMLSAAVFPLITSLLGGTKIQCSGPTGPMTTVFIAVIASSTPQVNDALMPQFLNLTIALTGVCLVLGGLLQLGKWIRLVPNVVISGFMNGIALLIWVSQLKKLLQIGSPIIDGSIALNSGVALATLAIALGVTTVAQRSHSKILSLLSGTLVALIVMTAVCTTLQLPIASTTPDIALHSWVELQQFIASHSPTNWPWHLTWLAVPVALQLAGVAYLDTLLTSLIIDRLRGTTSRRNQELVAQGVASGAVALIGGIPGAQATERSVLMLKEGAKTRMAGVWIGVFGLLGVFLLQDVIALIPKAVFAGILLKVGYDVFDWQPIILYTKQLVTSAKNSITHLQVSFIILTAIITVLSNIMIAVAVCTVLYYMLKQRKLTHDLQAGTESEGVSDEP